MAELTKAQVDWKKTVVVVALVALTALTVGGGAWYYADSGAESEIEAYKNQIATLETKVAQLEADQAAETTRVATLPSNIIDLKTVKVGDKVGPFTVKSVGQAVLDQSPPFGEKNALIYFEGTANVSGRYNYDPNSESNGRITFEPSQGSSQYIPTNLPNDVKFLLAGSEKIYNALGIKEGKAKSGLATIKISGFNFMAIESTVTKSTTFLSATEQN